MARYRVTGPDGATYEVTGPDDATDDEIIAAVQGHMQSSGSVTTTQPPKEELPDRTLGEFGKDIGTSLLAGGAGMMQGLVGLADLPTGGAAGKALEPYLDLEEVKKHYQSQYSPQQKAAQKAFEESEGILGSLKAIAENPSVIMSTAGESLPSMVGGAGLGRMVSKVPAVAGAIGEGLMGAGSAAEQIRQESPEGDLSGRGVASALGSGALTAALGYMGGSLAKRYGFSDIDTMMAGGTTGTAGNFAKRMIGSGITEGAFEELPQSVQEQMWMNYAQDKPIMEGVEKAGVLGAVTGGAMGSVAGALQSGVAEQPPADTETAALSEQPASELPSAIAPTIPAFTEQAQRVQQELDNEATSAMYADWLGTRDNKAFRELKGLDFNSLEDLDKMEEILGRTEVTPRALHREVDLSQPIVPEERVEQTQPSEMLADDEVKSVEKPYVPVTIAERDIQAQRERLLARQENAHVETIQPQEISSETIQAAPRAESVSEGDIEPATPASAVSPSVAVEGLKETPETTTAPGQAITELTPELQATQRVLEAYDAKPSFYPNIKAIHAVAKSMGVEGKTVVDKAEGIRAKINEAAKPIAPSEPSIAAPETAPITPETAPITPETAPKFSTDPSLPVAERLKANIEAIKGVDDRLATSLQKTLTNAEASGEFSKFFDIEGTERMVQRALEKHTLKTEGTTGTPIQPKLITVAQLFEEENKGRARKVKPEKLSDPRIAKAVDLINQITSRYAELGMDVRKLPSNLREKTQGHLQIQHLMAGVAAVLKKRDSAVGSSIMDDVLARSSNFIEDWDAAGRTNIPFTPKDVNGYNRSQFQQNQPTPSVASSEPSVATPETITSPQPETYANQTPETEPVLPDQRADQTGNVAQAAPSAGQPAVSAPEEVTRSPNRPSIKQQSYTKSGSTATQVKSWLPKQVKNMLAAGKLRIAQTAQEAASMGALPFNAGNGVEGFYNLKTDELWVIADNVTQDSLQSVLYHELLHRAEAQDPKVKAAMVRFEGAIKSSFDKAAQGLGIPIEREAYARVVNAKTPVKDQLEEFRAYLVSAYAKNPNSIIGVLRKAFNDFVAAIRAFLVRNGLDEGFIKSLSAGDLMAMSKYGTRVGSSKMEQATNGVKASTKAIIANSASWSTDRIDNLMRQFAYTMDDNKTKAYATWLSPSGYLDATTTKEYRQALENEREPLRENDLKSDEPIRLYVKDTSEEGVYQITGHEGRHRMMALRDAGVERVPVVIVLDTPLGNAQSVEEPYFKAQIHDGIKSERSVDSNYMTPISWAYKSELDSNFGRDADIRFSTVTNEAEPVRVEREKRSAIDRAVKYVETMLMSSDAAVQSDLRFYLEKMGLPWAQIQKVLLAANTAQAVHDGALGAEGVRAGKLVFDPSGMVKSVVVPDTVLGMENSVKRIGAAKNKSEAEISTIFQDLMNAWRARELHLEAENVRRIADEKTSRTEKAAYLKANRNKLTRSTITAASVLTQGDLPLTLEHANNIIKSTQADFPEFFAPDGPIAMWGRVRENTINFMVQSGHTSRSQAEQLLDAAAYVPWKRVMEAKDPDELVQNIYTGKATGFMRDRKQYKLKGSSREIQNIFRNIEQWQVRSLAMAVRNHKMLQLVDAARMYLPEGSVTKLGKFANKDGAISMYRHGMKEFYTFSDPLYPLAFRGLQTVSTDSLKFLQSFAEKFRRFIVLNPLFTISQLSQDTFAAMYASGLRNPLALPLEVAKQFIGTLTTGTEARTQLKRTGIVGAMDFSAQSMMRELDMELGLRGTAETTQQRIIHSLEKFSSYGDNAVRQAVYARTLKELSGDPNAEAIATIRAADIINFRRRGASAISDMIRQVTPFYGAYLQAQRVALHTLSGRGIAPTQRKEALTTLAMTTAQMAALGFIYAMANSGDDGYEKRSPSEMDNKLLVPGTEGNVAIPLRKDWTLLPHVIGIHAYRAIMGGFEDAETARKAITDTLVSSIAGVPIGPALIRPAIEVAIDHSFFTGEDIVGQGLEGLDTEQKYTANTSELGKLVGKTGVIAPVNFDHLMKGYLGLVSGTVFAATDAAIRTSMNIPYAEKDAWDVVRGSVPGISTFMMKGEPSGDAAKFYEFNKTVQNATKSIGRYEKTTPDEVSAIAEEKGALLDKGVKREMSKRQQELKKLREEELYILSVPNKEMLPAEKRERLNELKEQRRQVLAGIQDVRDAVYYRKKD